MFDIGEATPPGPPVAVPGGASGVWPGAGASGVRPGAGAIGLVGATADRLGGTYNAPT